MRHGCLSRVTCHTWWQAFSCRGRGSRMWRWPAGGAPDGHPQGKRCYGLDGAAAPASVPSCVLPTCRILPSARPVAPGTTPGPCVCATPPGVPFPGKRKSGVWKGNRPRGILCPCPVAVCLVGARCHEGGKVYRQLEKEGSSSGNELVRGELRLLPIWPIGDALPPPEG